LILAAILLFLILFIFFKFYDAIKVVNIRKNKKFGIKNWPMFFFMGVNGAKSKEKEDSNKHYRSCLLLSRTE
jgi:hypothetical protein